MSIISILILIMLMFFVVVLIEAKNKDISPDSFDFSG